MTQPRYPEMSRRFAGTRRVRSVAETLAAIDPFLTQAGITRVADVTGLDTPGIPTVMVVRPNSRSLSVAQGKGQNLECAKVSGVMESVEHYHAEGPTVPLRLARIGELLSEGAACNLDSLPAFPRLSGPLTPSTRLLWARAEDLLGTDDKWVPYEMVHLDLTLPLPEGSGHFPISSNGLASGNTLLEATTHALCELIERDARTLFFFASADEWAARRVDLVSIQDHECSSLLERFTSNDFSVAVWDITSDIEVACFLVGVLEARDNPFRRVPLAFGSGCHLDRDIALSRALTEAAQTRLTNIAGSRDDTPAHALDQARRDDAQANYREILRASTSHAMRSYETSPHTVNETLQDDLATLLGALQNQGIHQVLRIDLSQPSWPIAVVRMIVPGLEFLSEMPRYLPGERARAKQELTP